jgi:hypothetical protein
MGVEMSLTIAPARGVRTFKVHFLPLGYRKHELSYFFMELASLTKNFVESVKRRRC